MRNTKLHKLNQNEWVEAEGEKEAEKPMMEKFNDWFPKTHLHVSMHNEYLLLFMLLFYTLYSSLLAYLK